MVFFLNKIYKKASRNLQDIKHLKLIPKNHLVSDVFLVSYPKSGNTWMRFLLANAVRVHFNLEREVNFFNIHELMPSVHSYGKIPEKGLFGRSDLPRIIKSHAPYNPYYNNVIFLVRDPRDVCQSYYYYLAARRMQSSHDKSLSELIRDPKYGIRAWKKHTTSWVNKRRDGQNIKLFRFEDLIDNPLQEMTRLAKIIGINTSKETLEKAIHLSSKENMTELEKTTGGTPLIKIYDVRQGKINKGAYLSDADRKFIEEETRDVANLIGYDY
jgi:hypothetical protein